ncbi:MAG: GNAT family N-acetyltransferase [Alphaproteobacteria bacterium]|nr:GNAT family N-acetyltransferase [Alphaproteobacteria bacterium]
MLASSKTIELTVSPATQADVCDLLELGVLFAASSHVPGEFDINRARQTALYLLASEDAAVFKLSYGEQTVGFGIMVLDRPWMTKPWGYISTFFVAEHARESGGGAMLLGGLIEYARVNQCCAIFAASTAMISDGITSSYESLFGRWGFIDIGQTMMKEL